MTRLAGTRLAGTRLAGTVAARAQVSSVLAPVALIGGWTLAAALQPQGYSSLRDTISSLAALGTPHRWVMSTGFVVLGLSHIVTASGLPGANRPGRLVLTLGGVASAVLAAFPLPAEGSSSAHVLVAGIAFGALGLWPAIAGDTGSDGLLARRFGIPASVALLVLVFAFLLAPSAHVGIYERFAAGAQALWPLLVVQSCRAVQRSKSTR